MFMLCAGVVSRFCHGMAIEDLPYAGFLLVSIPSWHVAMPCSRQRHRQNVSRYGMQAGMQRAYSVCVPVAIMRSCILISGIQIFYQVLAVWCMPCQFVTAAGGICLTCLVGRLETRHRQAVILSYLHLCVAFAVLLLSFQSFVVSCRVSSIHEG